MLVGQHEGVLGRERVAVGAGLVGDDAAGRLGVEPLADVALVRAGALGELAGGAGAVGQRPVQADVVADGDERGVEGGAELGGELSGEGLDLGLVDGGEDAHGSIFRVDDPRSLRCP